ncbi:MAG: dockerin type I repeat-containing protein, partial [Oscillospiraceae bacterium]|nr:dockerin type I repeat-containing protein [Oscillospiraceae bacterium]
MKKQKLGFAALISTATIALAGMMTLPNVYASWEWRGYRGDLNYDNTVSVLDIVKMQRFLLRLDRLEGENIAQRADMNQDNTINITDLVILKNCVFYENFLDIWEEVADPITTTETNITTSTTTISTEITTETQSTTTETTTITEEAIFIDASIAAIQASLPTQGNANLVIFYVDFP